MQRVQPVFPVFALKRYQRAGDVQPLPAPVIIDDKQEYEVDRIAATRYMGSRRQLKVDWMGYGDRFTWEPVRNLTKCPERLQAYWDHVGKPNPHKL
jgi:hypothetical protein